MEVFRDRCGNWRAVYQDSCRSVGFVETKMGPIQHIRIYGNTDTLILTEIFLPKDINILTDTLKLRDTRHSQTSSQSKTPDHAVTDTLTHT